MDITSNPKEVGNRIKNIRKNLGLSMDEFASKIDDKAKSGTVSNWETGKNLPNNERLKRIAELGNISVETLLFGSITDFIFFNINKLIPKEYDFISELLNMDHINILTNEIIKNNISLFEIEKIKAVFDRNLPKFISDIENGFQKWLTYISKHKKYKETITELLSATNSSFDITGIDKVAYIFENADKLTLKEWILLRANIEDLYTTLENLVLDKTYFFDTDAILLEENSLIKDLKKIDLKNDEELEIISVSYKVKNKPYPDKIKSYNLLIKLENNVSEYAHKGDTLLIDYFQQFDQDLLNKYFIGEKLVIIDNQKIHIGVLKENLIIHSMSGENININNTEIKGNVFPLLAIYY